MLKLMLLSVATQKKSKVVVKIDNFNSSNQQDDEYGGEDDAEVQQECLHKFSTRDYIMEPSIFNTLKR